jgi:hypothetical protein
MSPHLDSASSDLLTAFFVFVLGYGYTVVRDVFRRKKANDEFEERKQHPIIEHFSLIETEDKWEDLIQGEQGNGEKLQDNIIANIKEKNIPDTIAVKREGGYGDNIECTVLCIQNKFSRYHEMLLFALDYGDYLDVRWLYAFDKPDRTFRGGSSFIVAILDDRERKRYETMLESDGRNTLGATNMGRWKEMINLVIKEEIKRMKEGEPKSGFHEQNKDAKGFVNLS